jgi:hypothetical protein
MNASDNHFELSLTKVNQAIQKLKTQPSKSILKKVSDATLVYNSQSDLNNIHLRDTSFQVNLNTLINAGLVECPQSQQLNRKSLIEHSSSETSITSNSSSTDSQIAVNTNTNTNSLAKTYSISISSSLSKYNEIVIPDFTEALSYEELDSKIAHDTTINNMSYILKKDLSLLTSSSSDSSETTSLNNLSDGSSLSLSEKTLNSKNADLDHSSNNAVSKANLKVEDYLNELQHLSNLNGFALSKNYILENEVEPLNVNTKANGNDESCRVIHTNNSETSSGYLSSSAMNGINTNPNTNNAVKLNIKNECLFHQHVSPKNNEKRFSYILATGSSNNLNIDSNDS